MKKFWKNWGGVIIFLLALVPAVMAEQVGYKSPWAMTLIGFAAALVATGFYFEIRSGVFDPQPETPKPGYCLYPEKNCLEIGIFCTRIVFIKNVTKVAMVIEEGGLFLVEFVQKSNTLTTDGNITNNVLKTESGDLTVSVIEGGYRVSWTPENDWVVY